VGADLWLSSYWKAGLTRNVRIYRYACGPLVMFLFVSCGILDAVGGTVIAVPSRALSNGGWANTFIPSPDLLR
jgi:hypothetical protein